MRSSIFMHQTQKIVSFPVPTAATRPPFVCATTVVRRGLISQIDTCVGMPEVCFFVLFNGAVLSSVPCDQWHWNEF